MDLSSLSPAPGSRKKGLRKGRGPGSHLGKTAGRGFNGTGSRSGGGKSAAFEGGQMPLQRRLPKRGFKAINPKIYQVVNLSDLEKKCEGTVTCEDLKKLGLIKNLKTPVKVLGRGSLSKTLTVKVNRFSESAKKAIEAVNGVAEVV